MTNFATQFVQIATQEIGVLEVNATNCGPRVDEYKSATNLNPKEPWPWCAAFVCWCVKQTMIARGVLETSTFKRPRTAGAWAFENWSLAQDNTTNTKKPHRKDILPGDIVVFTFSHIGIAISSPDNRGNIRTVEGNTNAKGSREGIGVFLKTRNIATIRSRIRFTI
jgi:hypothetical protein